MFVGQLAPQYRKTQGAKELEGFGDSFGRLYICRQVDVHRLSYMEAEKAAEAKKGVERSIR